jgi:hypothetical protein
MQRRASLVGLHENDEKPGDGSLPGSPKPRTRLRQKSVERYSQHYASRSPGLPRVGRASLAKEKRQIMAGGGWFWLLIGLGIGTLGVSLMAAIQMRTPGGKGHRSPDKAEKTPRDNFRRPF